MRSVWPLSGSVIGRMSPNRFGLPPMSSPANVTEVVLLGAVAKLAAAAENVSRPMIA